MKTYIKVLSFLFALLAMNIVSPLKAVAEDPPEDAILILDASGSMWGQIEGENKITIAREVLGQLLDDLPKNRRLGLMAYGHNKKGDCTDIEMLASVGADRAAMKTAIKNINPKGKTPISASVKQAAKLLKYTENKATVILISDGIETCNLDPCALGKQLEKDGVDFTAHVIGFDIVDKKAEDQLQCLANSTGGRYLSAANAGDLSLALGETIGQPQVVATSVKLTLEATILHKGPVIDTGLNWRVQQSGGGVVVYEGKDEGAVTQSVPPGVYDIFVTLPSDELQGETRLVEVRTGAHKAVSIALNPVFDASVTPDTEQVDAGAKFSVAWNGPDRKSDFITVTSPDAPARGYTSYAYTSNGNPAKLTAPILAGDYEVRYVLGNPRKVLARAPLKIIPASASVKGPDIAQSGSTEMIVWTGPSTQSDFITVTALGAKPSAYMDYFYTVNMSSPRALRMPLEPGDYEIRYVFVGKENSGGDTHRVIARQNIVIEQVAADISGPKTANVGGEVEIKWQGPKAQSGDFITVTRPDARSRKYTDYAYTKNGNPAKISMPVQPGDYELRFVQNNSKVIARQPISVTDISIVLTAPKTAKAGEEISVGFEGPRAQGDWITIIKPDARPSKYGDYFYAQNGSPQNLDMPKEAGLYEIRYVLKGKRIVARQDIIITK